MVALFVEFVDLMSEFDVGVTSAIRAHLPFCVSGLVRNAIRNTTNDKGWRAAELASSAF